MEGDLSDCLALLGSPIADRQVLTPRTLSGRESWRVRLQDGRTVKVRRLLSAQWASSTANFVNSLGFPGFVRVLQQSDRVLIEEWIEGEPLLHASAEHLAQAGRLLRKLHQSRPSFVDGVSPFLQKVVNMLTLLPSPLDQLEPLLRELAPESAQQGLIHYDFCGSNLVRDHGGKVWSVDNEWLRLGPLEYDLARSLTLWDLSDEAEVVFLQAYGASRPQLFWLVCGLIESAHNRLSGGLARANEPLEKLQRLLPRDFFEALRNGGIRERD